MRLTLADWDAANRAQDRMQNRLVIIFLVDDVADRPGTRELQDEGVHPADVIRHEKKAARRQVFQTARSDAIKTADQWPAKEIKRAFGRRHLASHRTCHSERSEAATQSRKVSGRGQAFNL